MSWSMTPRTSSRPSSSLNALPGPLSSMQCRHARLHSLVICQATYSGAARSDVCWSSMLFDDESLFLQLGQEGFRFRRHFPGRILELLLELGDEVRRLGARDDLAH